MSVIFFHLGFGVKSGLSILNSVRIHFKVHFRFGLEFLEDCFHEFLLNFFWLGKLFFQIYVGLYECVICSFDEDKSVFHRVRQCF